MTTTTSPEIPVSWKTALNHAGLFLLAAIIVAAVGIGLGTPADVNMDKLSQGVAQVSALIFVLAFVASYKLQKQQRTTGFLLFGLAALLVVAMPVTAIIATAHREPVVSDEVRAEFVRDAAGERLVHPTLGLSMAVPAPGFEPVHATARNIMDTRHQAVWSWANLDSGAALLVTVQPTGSERVDPVELLRGAWEGFVNEARASGVEVSMNTSTELRRTGAVGPMSLGVQAAEFAVGSERYVGVITVLEGDDSAMAAALDSIRTP
jgi:hypothetical protein